jgi:hypothetical protein
MSTLADTGAVQVYPLRETGRAGKLNLEVSERHPAAGRSIVDGAPIAVVSKFPGHHRTIPLTSGQYFQTALSS